MRELTKVESKKTFEATRSFFKKDSESSLAEKTHKYILALEAVAEEGRKEHLSRPHVIACTMCQAVHKLEQAKKALGK